MMISENYDIFQRFYTTYKNKSEKSVSIVTGPSDDIKLIT